MAGAIVIMVKLLHSGPVRGIGRVYIETRLPELSCKISDMSHQVVPYVISIKVHVNVRLPCEH